MPIRVGDTDLAVVSLRDISAEKRREVLERIFFHDVANTALGIMAVAELMGRQHPEAKSDTEYREDLRRLSRQIMEEIVAQRQLLEAERGDLVSNPEEVVVADVLDEVVSFYRHHPLTGGRRLRVERVPSGQIVTDAALLRRVLGNLVKNALEATPEGGTVTLGAEERGDEVACWVHNSAAIPEEVQQQLFHRSFSTRGGTGRGVGLHSVKLLTERYLGGRVTFTSTERGGTTFTVTLPQAPAGNAVGR
jgi:signal transduction histidine kinase